MLTLKPISLNALDYSAKLSVSLKIPFADFSVDDANEDQQFCDCTERPESLSLLPEMSGRRYDEASDAPSVGSKQEFGHHFQIQQHLSVIQSSQIYTFQHAFSTQ